MNKETKETNENLNKNNNNNKYFKNQKKILNIL